jgi:hypothetical protein
MVMNIVKTLRPKGDKASFYQNNLFDIHRIAKLDLGCYCNKSLLTSRLDSVKDINRI